MNTYGLLYLVAGECALLLAGFTTGELAAVLRKPGRRSGRVFEAVARNALALGALATLVGFTRTIQSFSGGAAQFLARVAEVSMTAFYAMIAAVLFGVLAAAQYRRNGAGEPPARSAGTRITMWVGYVMLAALLAWILVPPALAWGVAAWVFTIAGGVFLALLYGRFERGTGASIGFACAGLLGGVWGLLRALGAFSGGEIPPVAAALSFAVQSCSLGLAGMLLAGYPAQDRTEVSEDAGDLSRAAWYVTPPAALLVLAIVILLVITPIEKAA
jgi:hypothetical protein